MIRVGISGANGTMGRLTIGAIEAVDDLTIGGLYAPGRDDQDVLGYSASGDPAALSGCDVVIELTNPSAADENVPRWRESGADVLIGTSGYTVERVDALRDAWSGLTSRCLVVPNFSVGAVLMMRFAELAAPHFESVEIVEMHHHDKPDAPSGTALHTASRMAAARKHGAHNRGTEIVAGSLGGDVEGIPVHSLRHHGAKAHQEVIFGTVGQYLTVRHDTTDYACFAPGVILSLREIGSLDPGVTVGLESLFGI
ncbi:MAG: 4-hydroxy-tetrahydrodipicolinate reductase [Gammaproteobacteria bacterium]|nr:MAG: 4-hydroxy-tetrahydrodipicolinate reductase [Gammaproteobacteria bacterium]